MRTASKLRNIMILLALSLTMLFAASGTAQAASTTDIKTGQEYYITSAKYSGQAINMYVNSVSAIKNRTTVNLYKLDKTKTQRFTFSKNGSGNFLMIPSGSGFTVNVASLKAGTSVIAWKNAAANNEYFIIEKTGDGYYTFRMQNAPGLYLTADSKSKLTLRAKASDNSQKFAFHVYPDPVVTPTATKKQPTVPAVSSVRLNKTSLNILGKAVTLKATCSPAGASQKVTWKSSKPHVAAVNANGVVTPKGYGTCVITARSANGKTATCKVTVKRDNLITKTYAWMNVNKKINTKSVLGLAYYALPKKYRSMSAFKIKITDEVAIIVDGLTGKVVGTDCNSYVSKGGLGGLLTVTNTIKVYNKQPGYAEFKAVHKLSFGASTSILIGVTGISEGTASISYRLDNQGNLKLFNIKNY